MEAMANWVWWFTYKNGQFLQVSGKLPEGQLRKTTGTIVGYTTNINHGYVYPLVNWQFAIENGHRNSWFTNSKWWFSIAPLNYQRVYTVMIGFKRMVMKFYHPQTINFPNSGCPFSLFPGLAHLGNRGPLQNLHLPRSAAGHTLHLKKSPAGKSKELRDPVNFQCWGCWLLSQKLRKMVSR